MTARSASLRVTSFGWGFFAKEHLDLWPVCLDSVCKGELESWGDMHQCVRWHSMLQYCAYNRSLGQVSSGVGVGYVRLCISRIPLALPSMRRSHRPNIARSG